MFEIEYTSRVKPQDSDYILAFAKSAPDCMLLNVVADSAGNAGSGGGAGGAEGSVGRAVSCAKFLRFRDLQGAQVHLPSYIGKMKGRALWTGYVAEASIQGAEPSGQSGAQFLKMRRALELLGGASPSDVQAATRARIISNWRRRTQFCGICAGALVPDPNELAMYCESCAEYSYPQIAPAVIIAVERAVPTGSEILLVRSKRSISGYYGLVSGYVEAGETSEQAAHREIFEETGLKVCNLRYVQSQSWPFPNSQMLGFTANYESGEIRIQESELFDAKWFSAHSLPPQPPKLSISSLLIDNFRTKQYSSW